MYFYEIIGFSWGSKKKLKINPKQSPVAVTWRLAPSTRSQRTAARFWEAPAVSPKHLQGTGIPSVSQGFLILPWSCSSSVEWCPKYPKSENGLKPCDFTGRWRYHQYILLTPSHSVTSLGVPWVSITCLMVKLRRANVKSQWLELPNGTQLGPHYVA